MECSKQRNGCPELKRIFLSFPSILDALAPETGVGHLKAARVRKKFKNFTAESASRKCSGKGEQQIPSAIGHRAKCQLPEVNREFCAFSPHQFHTAVRNRGKLSLMANDSTNEKQQAHELIERLADERLLIGEPAVADDPIDLPR